MIDRDCIPKRRCCLFFCKITNFATYNKKPTPENEKLAYKAHTWNRL